MNSQTAHIFNSAIVSTSITAAYEIGIIDELWARKKLNISTFCRETDLHQGSVEAIIKVLNSIDIVKIDNDILLQGRLFSEIYNNKGYFLWMIGGYGKFLHNLAFLARNKNRINDFIKPNGKAVSVAGRDYGSQFVDPYFDKIIKEFSFQFVADLGCGSGNRLIKLAQKNPMIRGIGIDKDPEAIKVARSSIEKNGLKERISIYKEDITNLKTRPEFDKVDIIISFFCGHDFWPREICLATMQNIRAVFPNVKKMFLCDTYKSEMYSIEDIPIFTLGFELIHSVQDIYVPSLNEWINVFDESGWICSKQHNIDIPFSKIFDLQPNPFLNLND